MHEHFRRALEDCDIELVRKLWAHLFPNMPQPRDDAETLTTIHAARTHSQSIAFKHRAYSHRWLTERALPSGLPDYLKPKAERMYPRIVEGVGISVNTSRPERKELTRAIQQAMEAAVMDCYANGTTDPEFVKARMQEARSKVLKG